MIDIAFDAERAAQYKTYIEGPSRRTAVGDATNIPFAFERRVINHGYIPIAAEELINAERLTASFGIPVAVEYFDEFIVGTIRGAALGARNVRELTQILNRIDAATLNMLINEPSFGDVLQDDTPIHYAAMGHNVEAICTLCQYGADANAGGNPGGRQGWRSPLEVAIVARVTGASGPATVRALLSHGADPIPVAYAQRLLVSATDSYADDIVQLLRDSDTIRQRGCTACVSAGV